MLRRLNEVYEEFIALPLLGEMGQIFVSQLKVQGKAACWNTGSRYRYKCI